MMINLSQLVFGHVRALCLCPTDETQAAIRIRTAEGVTALNSFCSVELQRPLPARPDQPRPNGFSGTQWNKPTPTSFILRAIGHRAGQGCERSTEADQDAHSRWRHAFRCRRPCSLRTRGKGDQGLKRTDPCRAGQRDRGTALPGKRGVGLVTHSSHRRVRK